jgi:transcriptional regulator with XRE-family HTH domain
MTTRQEIGQRVLLRRRDLGMTQKELAERCGFPYQVISGLERGRQSIYAERLGVLAEALKVSADMLLGLRDAADDADTTPPQPTRQRTRKPAAPVA